MEENHSTVGGFVDSTCYTQWFLFTEGTVLNPVHTDAHQKNFFFLKSVTL